MASTYSNLKIELMGTGDQSGTWGVTTNTNLGTAIEEAITGSADVSFASADVTLTLTNTNTSQTARNLRLNLTGTSGGARNLTVPDIEKFYIIANGLADDVTVKNSTGTTYTVPAGTTGQVFSTGTGIKAGSSFFEGELLSSAAYILGGEIENTPIGAVTPKSGAFTTVSASTSMTAPTKAPGTNTSDVATTAFVQSATGTLGTMSTQNANAVSITGGSINNTTIGGATPNTGAFTTLSANSTTTLSGPTSANALVTAGETTTISATAATGTVNYDVLTQSVLYYTTNASGNWTLNLRASSSTSLNSIMAVGETRTVTFLATQGATPYYNSAVTIDSVSVTPKWQNGTTPSVGYASGIDVYTYSVIKTASATFTVLASQTKFS